MACVAAEWQKCGLCEWARRSNGPAYIDGVKADFGAYLNVARCLTLSMGSAAFWSTAWFQPGQNGATPTAWHLLTRFDITFLLLAEHLALELALAVQRGLSVRVDFSARAHRQVALPVM